MGDQVIIDLIIFLKLGYLCPDKMPILYIYITRNWSKIWSIATTLAFPLLRLPRIKRPQRRPIPFPILCCLYPIHSNSLLKPREMNPFFHMSTLRPIQPPPSGRQNVGNLKGYLWQFCTRIIAVMLSHPMPNCYINRITYPTTYDCINSMYRLEMNAKNFIRISISTWFISVRSNQVNQRIF